MKLYYSPGACSLSPHITLREAGLPFELVLASTKTHRLADGTDFRTINPKGYVPVLELDDGERLTEGPVIVQYIADRVPDRRLVAAAGTMERYRAQEWLNFIGTELHKGFGPLFRPDTPESYKPAVRQKLQQRLAWTDGQLADRPFLMGVSYTVPDGYLYVMLRWASAMGVDYADNANLTAFKDRMDVRPAVQAALRAEEEGKQQQQQQ